LRREGSEEHPTPPARQPPPLLRTHRPGRHPGGSEPSQLLEADAGHPVASRLHHSTPLRSTLNMQHPLFAPEQCSIALHRGGCRGSGHRRAGSVRTAVRTAAGPAAYSSGARHTETVRLIPAILLISSRARTSTAQHGTALPVGSEPRRERSWGKVGASSGAEWRTADRRMVSGSTTAAPARLALRVPPPTPRARRRPTTKNRRAPLRGTPVRTVIQRSVIGLLEATPEAFLHSFRETAARLALTDMALDPLDHSGTGPLRLGRGPLGVLLLPPGRA